MGVRVSEPHVKRRQNPLRVSPADPRLDHQNLPFSARWHYTFELQGEHVRRVRVCDADGVNGLRFPVGGGA